VARGIYVDAADAGELQRALGKAAAAAPVPAKKIEAVGKAGKLRLQGASAYPHEVTDAASGRQVAVLSAVWPERELPPGIYNVRFDNGTWKGVEVKADETTVLRPGILEIANADLWGNELLDPETNELVGKLLPHKNRMLLLPTRVVVRFGRMTWPEIVEIKEGATTRLTPGVIKAASSKPFKVTVSGPDGRPVHEISSSVHTIALPAGSYTLDMPDRKMPIELAAGQTLEIRLP
jgi:hypothetical protein